MPSSQIERKLAAIMFTDIAGYTALSAKDSTKASELLKTQKDTLKPIVEKHGGSWMKEMGDGLLLTFDSATSAVECSIAIQEATKDLEDLNLRIGIHEGEVIKQDGDVIGDDVNVTSRIEPFSAVGGVAISQKIQQAISSNSEFETSYIGKPELKGVAQEVKVYCITSHELPKADEIVEPIIIESKSNFNIFALTGGILTAIGVAFWIAVGVFDVSFGGKAEVPSVGILMMENRGGEEDEFWASGIIQDLIVKVAEAGLIRVAPMKEILEVNKKESFEEIAKKLRVKYILTSSIYKKEDGFDLHCQLIEAESGNSKYANKWSESIDKAPTIVGNLADNILKSLKVSTKQEITKVPTNNPEAYEFYLKGRYKHEQHMNIEDVKIARGLLRKAIELDDKLIKAKIELGWTYYHDALEYDTTMDFFTSALKQAEVIDDKSGVSNALNAIGIIYFHTSEHDSTFSYDVSLDYHNRSLQVSKEIGNRIGVGGSLNNIGGIHRAKGDLNLALDYYRRSDSIAKEINELDMKRTTTWNIGLTYDIQGDYEKALDYYGRSLAIAEELGDKRRIQSILLKIGFVYYYDKGDLDKALDYYERSLAIAEELGDKFEMGFSLLHIGWAYYIIGEYKKALEYYNRELKINEELDYKDDISNNFANRGLVYFQQAVYNKAVENLDKSATMQMELDSTITLETLSHLFLSKKILGKEYSVSEIQTLITQKDEVDDYINYALYQLLEDTSYLETAHNQVKEKAQNLEPDVKLKFLSYPIPKAIVEEWEKVK